MLPGEFDASVAAVLGEGFVDEHAAVVRIDAVYGIGQLPADGFQRPAITLNPMGKGVATGIVEDYRRNLLSDLTKAPIILANCILLILDLIRTVAVT